MEDPVSMCERRCRKACNLRSAAEDSEEPCHSGSSGGRARRYRKRGSHKPAAGDAGAMDTDPSPVRLWESEGHLGCGKSGGKQAECHCEHVSFLMGKYPKMGMDAIVHRLDSLDNAKDGLEEDVAGILDDQSAAEKDMEELRAERDRYRENLELALEKQQRVVDSLLHLVEDMSGRLKRLEELQPLASGPELPA